MTFLDPGAFIGTNPPSLTANFRVAGNHLTSTRTASAGPEFKRLISAIEIHQLQKFRPFQWDAPLAISEIIQK
jgi:hypothetical protein